MGTAVTTTNSYGTNVLHNILDVILKIQFNNIGFIWSSITDPIVIFKNCIFNGRSITPNNSYAGMYAGWIKNSYAYGLQVKFYSCTFFNNYLQFTTPGSGAPQPIVEFYDCISNQSPSGWTITANINNDWVDNTINSTTFVSTKNGTNRGVYSQVRT